MGEQGVNGVGARLQAVLLSMQSSGLGEAG